MSTAATILSLAYHQLRAEQGSTDVPGLSETDMLSVLNTVNQEWQRVFRRDEGEPLISRRGEKGIDLIGTTNLSADVASGASTFTVDDGSSFESSGAGAVWDNDDPDIFEFSRSGNTFTVSGIDWAHEDGDTVQQLYALPSNFESFRSEESNPSGVTLGGIPMNYTTDPPSGIDFAIYDNGTTKYLWFSRGLTGSVRVVYNKTTTTIDDLNDSIDIPSNYDWFAVYRLIAHGKRSRGDVIQRIQYQSGEMVDEDDARANTILIEAQMERNVNKGPKVRSIGFVRIPTARTNFREI